MMQVHSGSLDKVDFKSGVNSGVKSGVKNSVNSGVIFFIK